MTGGGDVFVSFLPARVRAAEDVGAERGGGVLDGPAVVRQQLRGGVVKKELRLRAPSAQSWAAGRYEGEI